MERTNVTYSGCLNVLAVCGIDGTAAFGNARNLYNFAIHSFTPSFTVARSKQPHCTAYCTLRLASSALHRYSFHQSVSRSVTHHCHSFHHSSMLSSLFQLCINSSIYSSHSIIHSPIHLLINTLRSMLTKLFCYSIFSAACVQFINITSEQWTIIFKQLPY